MPIAERFISSSSWLNAVTTKKQRAIKENRNFFMSWVVFDEPDKNNGCFRKRENYLLAILVAFPGFFLPNTSTFTFANPREV